MVFGFLAVLLGAFGAHAIKQHISPTAFETWKTAVSYQMFHTLVILLISLATVPAHRLLVMANSFFTAGVLVFSGSLYLLVVTGIRAFGMLTPIGGVLFLLGWLLLFVWSVQYVRARS